MNGLAQIVLIYIGLGAAFSVGFFQRGYKVIAPDAEESSILLRLMVLPGVMLLWPLLLLKWIGARR